MANCPSRVLPAWERARTPNLGTGDERSRTHKMRHFHVPIITDFSSVANYNAKKKLDILIHMNTRHRAKLG
jgi:hypothetical protein